MKIFSEAQGFKAAVYSISLNTRFCHGYFYTEAPIEEIAVIKKDGKLHVDAFDGSGENVVTTEQPISESGKARKLKFLVLTLFMFKFMLFSVFREL